MLLYFLIITLHHVLKIIKNISFVIERCFPKTADSLNFSELVLILLKTILASSELFVDSELQVINAENNQLPHNITERSKHAKHLLRKIRLSLLTVPALKHVLKLNSCLVLNEKCVEFIKEAMQNMNDNQSSIKSIEVLIRFATSLFC